MPDIAVKPSQTEGEKAVPVPKFPSERDLERHLIDVGKGLPKEKEPPQEKEPTTEQLKKEETKKEESKKEETKEKKPTDIQLERALELLKSWENFKGVAQGK